MENQDQLVFLIWVVMKNNKTPNLLKGAYLHTMPAYLKTFSVL
jgi:hypothetical protein